MYQALFFSLLSQRSKEAKKKRKKNNAWSQVTCRVANATRFYSLATNFSRLVARLAPRFFDLVLKFLIEFNTLILLCSCMKPMKSCSFDFGYLLANAKWNLHARVRIVNFFNANFCWHLSPLRQSVAWQPKWELCW